ncbi:MAG: pantoate--beta-alanine ligase [Stagnimonas sp.]|nr:pantoate--beta-alanine ligase [Stagnimonas sp.]
MQTVHTVAELRQQLATWRAAGECIAFAPTMGNLHAGHIDLIHAGLTQASRVVASVFVNPLQFGPKEDFGRYPRTLPDDAAKLEAAGCDLLFAPSVEAMYPHALPLTTQVQVSQVSEGLEGAFRPGHFEGVATVVNVLFNLVRPDVALFGEKDWQQLAVITRMVRDLHLPIEVVGVPTRRESSGLAMSSRNQYLGDAERTTAAVIYATLMTIAHELQQGSRDFRGLEQAGMQALQAHGFEPQYVAIRSPDLQSPANENNSLVVLAAALLGKTRLIDNLRVAL